jgi:hypothetical protein
MNGAHLHLMINHLPVIGTLLATGLLAVAVLRANDTLRRTALALLVLGGFAAGAAQLSGEPAEEVVEDRATVNESAIESHEDAAKLATIGAAILAVGAVGTLLAFRGRGVPTAATAVLFAGGLAVSGAMAWTANLGGRISHPEIAAASSVASPRLHADPVE